MRFVGDDRDDGALQSDVVEHPAQPAVVRGVRHIEHGHFDAVEAGLFQRSQHRQMLLGHMTGPEQQVHADLH